MNVHQPLSEAGQAALSLARMGWPVFPCDQRVERCKRPLTPHGFKDASIDPVQIETWWRQWPDALIGVPTGPLSGIFVVDLDLDPEKEIDGPAAIARLEAEHERLPETLKTRTPRGGLHLLFAWDPERPVTNSSGSLPTGIDIRGDGGYVIVPPSKRQDGASYRWENPPGLFQPVPAPTWLYRLILTKRDDKAKAPRDEEPDFRQDDDVFGFQTGPGKREVAWARAALEGGAREVELAPDTSRNNTLNAVAYRLGRMIARGWLSRAEVEVRLLDAATANGLVADDGRRAAEATIKSGIDAGMRNPHEGLSDWKQAGEQEAATAGSCGVSKEDFYAYMPQHNYIFGPSREMWPAASVNARLAPIPLTNGDGTLILDDKGKPKTLSANAWIDQNRPVEQLTWSPAHPAVVQGKLISEGGWIDRPGSNVLNLYRPPALVPKDGDVSPWLDHVKRVYPEEADHIIKWLAHRVQNPGEKINHALVLGGSQGIGKDTLLEPVKWAVGPWNFSEVSPQHLLGQFNGFLKSVILRVSEARDLGDMDRFAFYDHMKAYTAAPPDVLRVNEKHLREHSVVNVCGIVITSNHKSDGIYLPADDRRHFVAWSPLSKADFDEHYWRDLYHWFANGGAAIVAHYLSGLDLSAFDPKSPPPKTAAFWDIVNASRAPEDAELADVLESLGWPETVTLARLIAKAPDEFGEWLQDRKNSRRIPHRLEDAGYVPVRNPGAKDGLWKVGGKRQVIYAKATLSPHDRLQAAAAHGGSAGYGQSGRRSD